MLKKRIEIPFTFQYVSINTERMRTVAVVNLNLHSNMFLLIPGAQTGSGATASFTFQYVSINTELSTKRFWKRFYLHSNMFLLIPDFLSLHSHSTVPFTFQYVSINTHMRTHGSPWIRHLHSNMFLLIQKIPPAGSSTFFIYIPICFY